MFCFSFGCFSNFYLFPSPVTQKWRWCLRQMETLTLLQLIKHLLMAPRRMNTRIQINRSVMTLPWDVDGAGFGATLSRLMAQLVAAFARKDFRPAKVAVLATCIGTCLPNTLTFSKRQYPTQQWRGRHQVMKNTLQQILNGSTRSLAMKEIIILTPLPYIKCAVLGCLRDRWGGLGIDKKRPAA